MKFSSRDSTEQPNAPRERRRSKRATGSPPAASPSGGPPPADAYAPPRLLVYGVVRDLTASGGRFGKHDKAVKHSRTGF